MHLVRLFNRLDSGGNTDVPRDIDNLSGGSVYDDTSKTGSYKDIVKPDAPLASGQLINAKPAMNRAIRKTLVALKFTITLQ